MQEITDLQSMEAKIPSLNRMYHEARTTIEAYERSLSIFLLPPHAPPPPAVNHQRERDHYIAESGLSEPCERDNKLQALFSPLSECIDWLNHLSMSTSYNLVIAILRRTPNKKASNDLFEVALARAIVIRLDPP